MGTPTPSATKDISTQIGLVDFQTGKKQYMKRIGIIFIALAAGNICKELYCVRCDNLIHSIDPIATRIGDFCRMLLTIENCCIRYFGSGNAIVPDTSEDYNDGSGENDEMLKTMLMDIGVITLIVANGNLPLM